jgi:hypothetical protein
LCEKASSGKTAGRGFFFADRSGRDKFFASFPSYGRFSEMSAARLLTWPLIALDLFSLTQLPSAEPKNSKAARPP